MHQGVTTRDSCDRTLASLRPRARWNCSPVDSGDGRCLVSSESEGAEKGLNKRKRLTVVCRATQGINRKQPSNVMSLNMDIKCDSGYN